jgi:hypothetical protein
MFELHAWCCAAGSDSPGEDTAPHLGGWLDAEIRRRGLDEWATAANVNGEPYFIMHCLRNHEANTLGRVIELLRELGLQAIESYGLVYALDDEGPTPDRFRVWVMARGSLTERDDPFLSPTVPILEDPPSGL